MDQFYVVINLKFIVNVWRLHIGLQLSIKRNWQLLDITTFHLEDNDYNSYQWIINNIRLFC